ncbi:transporter substrate-binding domain-containing protein [Neisseriaceae bacterium TC5R-5]|nr:transporter substrate-binding domain-containing protein [Neisseriaceae bacterium TC5R-5]
MGKMIKSVSIALYFAGMLCANLISAATLEAVKINIDANNPPFMFAASHQAAGLYPALTTAIFQKLGVPVELTALPWKQVLAQADRAQAGIAGIYKTQQRAAKYDYSKLLFVEKIGVYFNIAQPVKFNNIADLSHLKLGVVSGWSYGDAFDKARKEGLFTVEEAASDQQNLIKLQNKKIDVALMIVDAADLLIDTENAKTIKFSRKLFQENPTYIIFNKQANKKELLNKINVVLHDMISSGEYYRIVKKSLSIAGK